MWVSKEATLKEVLQEVSLADLGDTLKYLLSGLGCWVIFILIGAVLDGTAKATGLWDGLHVPSIVGIGVLVGFLTSFASQKSYHEVNWSFWFPKVGFFGWMMLTAYITGTIEAFRLSHRMMPDSLSRWLADTAIYVFLVGPAILFFGLSQLGHERLMKKRQAGAQAE